MAEKKFKQYDEMKWSQWEKEILQFWKENKIFEKSVEGNKDGQLFSFYEGPPSANGRPGIHHVLSRTVKDHVCRYKTMKGYYVPRKGGWDTHGLPVELAVEKKLGIRKTDIGVKISVADFNKECEQEVFKYKQAWEELTERMGFWIDLENAYITCDRDYIESLWWALKKLYEKGLLYQDYTIQPYSPAAGTALSSHELNLPGCYRPVKDQTITALFQDRDNEDLYYLAWTTTPWTLPANVALAVGPDIDYVEVQTVHPYTGKPIRVILAKDRLHAYFKPENEGKDPSEYTGDRNELPWKIIRTFKGKELAGRHYKQLIPYVTPTEGDPFRIVTGDFVSTEEGTGIVHIAPAHGADDFAVAKKEGLPMILLIDKEGRFTKDASELAGLPVKDFYDEGAPDVDQIILKKLIEEGKVFKAEKYEHNYPHCWRTDKPVIFYPIRSWFIKVSQFRDRLIELNKTIWWQPPEVGEGRFGKWLENVIDWNLSRQRYWGTPLPAWTTEDGKEVKVIGSFEELRQEVQKSIEAGYMKEQLPENFDPHRPYVDEIILVSDSGKPMRRVTDVIDVWFDSGAMPFAQWHYPFENQDTFKERFPADFIAEGIDQTRGWFYTLHVLATLLFDSVAYKSVIVNGLVLDRHGNKMSKRLGNVVEPMSLFDKYGADAVRWYMMVVNPPWENLRFDAEGPAEVLRRFFRALFNTYQFFALYANVDGFRYEEKDIPHEDRPLMDRWLLSRIQTLIKEVDEAYENYEPTTVARLIQRFVIDELSNWYVRLSRRRFWKSEYNTDKISGFQTLWKALETVAKLMAPLAPFYADRLYKDLHEPVRLGSKESVHLERFPTPDESLQNKELEWAMDLAQKVVHLALSLRKKHNVKVRQPLAKLLILSSDEKAADYVAMLEDIIKTEVNVKNVEVVKDTRQWVRRRLKPRFNKLGPRFGKKVKEVASLISNLDPDTVEEFLSKGEWTFTLSDGEQATISTDDVEIIHENIEGWISDSEGPITVALDINITDDLLHEGMARELVNRIQKVRKDRNLDVVDRIKLFIENKDWIKPVIEKFGDYIKNETLATEIELTDQLNNGTDVDVYGKTVKVDVVKV